ncbi:MAG: TatD family deoxyribonuclease [Clostridiales bacterium]|nr:TatD family deoxyribonuclease [Clostridiales bacterium]
MIDSHAHLNDARYDDVPQIVSNMHADGLKKIVVVGYDVDSSFRALELAKEHKDIYCAVGVHPSDCAELSDSQIDSLVELCGHEKTVAYGEIGLDYYYDTVDRAVQREALIRQLYAVKRTGLPAVFHLRDAYEDMENIIREHRDCLSGGAVMHCFSGSKETALKYVDMGFYISFSGAITFKNAVKAPEIIKALPLDRILVETDCPYLTPVPHRGKLNYPTYVRFVAAKVAEVLGKSVEEIEEITEQNTYNIFTKMKR